MSLIKTEIRNNIGTICFNNDEKRFGPPHHDALDPTKCADLVRAIETVLADGQQ